MVLSHVVTIATYSVIADDCEVYVLFRLKLIANSFRLLAPAQANDSLVAVR